LIVLFAFFSAILFFFLVVLACSRLENSFLAVHRGNA
jgi:hypothetical protein